MRDGSSQGRKAPAPVARSFVKLVGSVEERVTPGRLGGQEGVECRRAGTICVGGGWVEPGGRLCVVWVGWSHIRHCLCNKVFTGDETRVKR